MNVRPIFNHFVNLDTSEKTDNLENSIDLCTDIFEQSCDKAREMPFQNDEQKQNVNLLYKLGKKIVNSEASVNFLNESLDKKFVPKCFKINKVIPGNQNLIQQKFDRISMEAVLDEKRRHDHDHLS